MQKYKLLLSTNIDQIGLDSYLGTIERQPTSTLTTTKEPSILFQPNPTGKYIKLLIVAGTLVTASLPLSNIKLKTPSSKGNLAHLSNIVEEPFKKFMSEFNRLIGTKNNITKNELFEKIIAFRSLNKNWDGYGAIPLEVKSASNAIKFINLLDEKITKNINDVYPTPNGTISFLWENDANERVSLELGNKTLSYYVKLNSQRPYFFNDIEINSKETKVISDFIKSL